jgi:heat shock protein HslJ
MLPRAGRALPLGPEPLRLPQPSKPLMRTLTAPVLLTTMFLTACGTEDSPIGEQFSDDTWRLVAGTIDGAPLRLVAGYPVTLAVDGESVGGRSACNHYGGTAARNGARISFDDLHLTAMFCPDDGVMDLETAYLSALGRVDTAARDGDHLLLTADGVTLRFQRVPPEPDAALFGTLWSLDTLIVGEAASTPAADAELRIEADGTVTGHTGCNELGGRYDEGSGFSNIVMTRIGCEDSIMVQEILIAEVLGSAPTLTIVGSVLTITGPDGRALQYRAS